MKKIVILFMLFIILSRVSAQNDPEALKILDRFSSVALASPSVSLKFSLITINQAEQSNDTINGLIVMAKERYRLEFPDNITWFNGSTVWNYLIAEKEVTITRPDKKDDTFLSRPSAIFSIYKKGYKTRFAGEKNNSFVIDLYPDDIKSDLVRIRLVIGKSASDLIGAEYKRKDGLVIYLAVNEYNLKTKPDQSVFTFDPQNYKGVEIIDMR